MTPRSKAPQRRSPLLPEEQIALRALTDEEPAVRRSAVLVLDSRRGQRHRPEIAAVLRGLLRDPDDDTRAAALEALGWTKGGTTVTMLPELARIADDKTASAALREQALTGIGKFGPRAALHVPMLLRLIETRPREDGRDLIAHLAACVLESVGDASALATVVKAVEAGRCDWSVLRAFTRAPAGRAALRGLAQRLAPQLLKVARDETEHSDFDVSLLKLTKKDKGDGRGRVDTEFASDLIGVLGGGDVMTFRRLLGLVEGRRNTKALATAVADLGPPGRRALIEVLNDGSSEQRRRALEVVERLRSPAVTKTLLRAVEKCCTDGNAAIRAKAVTVYAHLASRSRSRS